MPWQAPSDWVKDVTFDQPSFGNLWVWASDGSRWFYSNFSSVFRPKSTLIPLPLFRISKGKYQSPCTHLSVEYLPWLASTIRLLPNLALPITSSFDRLVVANNKICSILVRLVSVDWSLYQYGYLLMVFLPNRVVSSSLGRLSRYYFKWETHEIYVLVIPF